MNKTIPSSYGCELNGNVETIFEGASTLAVKKTCNIMGMRCTICTDEKRLVNITSIDVKTYDPVNSVNGEEVIFSPEFYPGTLRPGTVGYKTEITVHDLNLPSEDAIIVERYNAACNDRQVHGNSFIKLAGRSGEKTWYKHDPRLRLIDNSLKTPANVSAFEDTASTCPSVPKSFLNRGSCVKLSSACSPLKFTNGMKRKNATINWE